MAKQSKPQEKKQIVPQLPEGMRYLSLFRCNHPVQGVGVANTRSSFRAGQDGVKYITEKEGVVKVWMENSDHHIIFTSTGVGLFEAKLEKEFDPVVNTRQRAPKQQKESLLKGPDE